MVTVLCRVKNGSSFMLCSSGPVNCSHQRNFWEVWWCAWSRMSLLALGFGTADSWPPLFACAAAGCSMWNEDKGLLRIYFCLIYFSFYSWKFTWNMLVNCCILWEPHGIIGPRGGLIVWKNESYTLEIIWEVKVDILNLHFKFAFTIIYLFYSIQKE